MMMDPRIKDVCEITDIDVRQIELVRITEKPEDDIWIVQINWIEYPDTNQISDKDS